MLVDCKECSGTGIYVGFAEKEGSAVVCYRCKGTGAVEFQPPPAFTGRKVRKGVKTVALKNQGIVLAPGIDQGEVNYEAFLNGAMPTLDAELYERVTGKKQRA